MATQVTYPATASPDATDWQEFIAWLQKVQRGYINIEIDETNKQVEAGSIVEVNGEVLYSSTDENITDNGETWASISNSTVFYVYAVGAADDEYQYSTTAPSWDNDKGGWYNGNNRAVCKAYKNASGDMQDSIIYVNLNEPFQDRGLIPSLVESYDDLEADGTDIEGRVIYCRNFHVTATTTLKSRIVYIEGDLTIDYETILTLDAVNRVDSADTEPGPDSESKGSYGGENGVTHGGTATTPAARTLYSWPYFLEAAIGGAGGRGGRSTESGSIDGGDGGGSFQAGGKGGNPGGETYRAGGGGGAIGANGGDSGYGTPYGAGSGGFTIFIVRGNCNIEGSIRANGSNGSSANGLRRGGAGGGGGGIMVIFCLGTYSNTGILSATGGDGGDRYNSDGGDGGGGGGGGGHIEVWAKTATFGTLSVGGGEGGRGYLNQAAYEGVDGGTGTTTTVNISSGYKLNGGTDDYPLWWERLIEGIQK